MKFFAGLVCSFILGACALASKTSRDIASTRAQMIGLEFVRIEPGRFVMGSPVEEFHHQPNEKRRTVEINLPFEISNTEVTQQLWFDVMKSNPSFHREKRHCEEDHRIVQVADERIELCPHLPVESVAWVDAQAFLANYNKMQANDPYFYRLPTEAEWEYAARAGTQTAYSYGDDPFQADDYGWYNRNSGGQSRSVGQKIPNGNQLFDMHGNVAEWVTDEMPVRYTKRVHRVFRGGSWMRDRQDLRSAYRGYTPEANRSNDIGFRMVRALKSADAQNR